MPRVKGSTRMRRRPRSNVQNLSLRYTLPPDHSVTAHSPLLRRQYDGLYVLCTSVINPLYLI